MNYFSTYLLERDTEEREPRIMGECFNCKDELREDYTYFRDEEDNTFCCTKCALEFYGLRETEWPYEYDD